jgi:hypothetical protein
MYLMKVKLGSLVQLIPGVYKLDKLHSKELSYQGLVLFEVFDTM